jgi:hypothetical protein
MPIISRSVPRALPPEGPAKCQVMQVDSGRSSKKEVPYFELTLKDLASGLTFKESIYLSASCAWKVENACRSAGLSLPDGEYRLVPDDFENRIIYGNIVHKTLPTSGKKVAELKSFWSKEHAIKQAPALAEIPDPEDTPEPMTLPSAAKAKSAEPQQAIARAMQHAAPVELSEPAVFGL